MIKNVFYNLQQLLGNDFVLFYLGKSEDLTREEKNLYEKKTIGMFYARGNYLPFRDTKGMEAEGTLVLEIPLGNNESGLQAAMNAFETLVNNTNGEILYEGQGYNYVFKWQFPVPIGNVDNTYGAKRQPYQLNFSLVISDGLLATNEVSIKVDGEDLEGITFWNENSIIQTQEQTNINEFGTRSEGLTRTYVLKVQGLVKDISLWERLIQDAYDENDYEYYVEATFGQGKVKSFLAVISNITRTGQVGGFQAYELVFVLATQSGYLDLVFDGNGGEWEIAESFSLTYNSNGGTGTMTDPDSPYDEGSTAVILQNNFLREGYTFIGWNTAQDGSGTSYMPNDEVEITADLVLYAQWSQVGTLTVSYAGNGGVSTITDSNQYESGATVTVLFSPEPTRNNYKFIGWAQSVTTEPTYTQSETNTFVITNNTTLYAVWRPLNIITMSFTAEKIIATASEAVKSNVQIVVYYIADGEELSDTITILEDETIGEIEIEGVEELIVAVATPKYDSYFYYNPIIGDVEYKSVTYNSNGGTGTMQPQVVISGGNVTLRPNTFTKEGEYFMGWATSSDGIVAYADSAILSNITENITLYAIWGYQVVFNGNGGQW